MIVSLQSWIEQTLASGELGFFSFLLLFLGGLVASLLPCVYPLYPITIGILQKRNSDQKWIHPSLYYLGLALAYFSFGWIAGASGGTFNHLLKSPFTNLFLAWVLLALGFSTLDLLPLRVFGGDSNIEKREGWWGTLTLGFFAGVLSSPCVGPVVVAILVQIAASQESGFSWTATWIASVKMFFFGMGLGLPFLLLGVFRTQLPRSGKWMRNVQIVFGILILYFAFTYLDKAIVLFLFPKEIAILVFCGFVSCLFLAYSWQSEELFRTYRFQKAFSQTSFAFVLLIVGLAMVLRNPSNGTTSNEIRSFVETQGNLVWFRNEKDVYAEAKAKNQRIFIDFYADWCTNCKEFHKLTQNNPELNQALQKAVLWKIYDTDVIFEIFAEDPRFPELKIGLPFFVVLKPGGDLIYKSTNYLDTAEMVRAIESN